MLLHGWGLHGGVWHALAARLARAFRVHLVDLPGHGHSRDVAFGGLDAVADAVAECVPEGARVRLVAGRAHRAAPRHAPPCARRALALVGTTPCFVQRDGWPHAMARGTLAGFRGGARTRPRRRSRAFVQLNALGGAARRATAMRELAALLVERGAPSAGALAAGLALLRDTDLRDEAATIDRPAVVIHGARDALAPVDAGRWLAGALPDRALLEHRRRRAPALRQPHRRRVARAHWRALHG